MSVRIYDTLSRDLQPVQPQDPDGPLGFYCCGPTVYAAAHIGNFRTFVVQDVFRRVAEISGIKVKHVRNLTNVDDKTIAATRDQGKSLKEVTDEWTSKFHRDCEALNLLPPHVEPGAVEHIPEQIQLIETLMEKGVAYQGGDGSVYFSIDRFEDYGRLSGVKDRELRTGTTETADEYDRDSMADFVLWKAAKEEDGDNVWESPWGPGRPGWHLECSAMSMKYLGPSFDVHSGGIDLTFPHHENEIAQSEACTGQTFSRLWFHVVHLMVDGKKMAKRLGNMYTLGDLEAKGYKAAEVRYALIAGHYRKHLNFTLDSVEAARGNLRRLARFGDALDNQFASERPGFEDVVRRLSSGEGPGVFEKAMEALRENLNVPGALGELFGAVGVLERNPGTAGEADRLGFYGVMHALGLSLPETVHQDVPEEVRNMAEKRSVARTEKNWAESDRLRDGIQALGWTVKDVKDGYELTPES